MSKRSNQRPAYNRIQDHTVYREPDSAQCKGSGMEAVGETIGAIVRCVYCGNSVVVQPVTK